MGWRSASGLATVVYREVAFQAIHAVRLGNVLAPPKPGENLSEAALRRVTQSKLLLNLLLVSLNVGVFAAIRVGPGAFLVQVYPALFDMSLIVALLFLELSLLWMTGVQILPTLLGSKVFHTLAALPLSKAEVDRTAFLVLLRLFDIPALTAVILTPLTVAWAFGVWQAGLAVLPGVVVMVTLSIGLSLWTGRFFVRRVEGARGGGRSTIVRWALLVTWALPAFAIYAFISFSPELLKLLDQLGTDPTGVPYQLLSVTFPFPYALLATISGDRFGAPATTSFPLLLLAGFAYLFVAAFVGTRILQAPRRLSELTPATDHGPTRSLGRISTVGAGSAVLLKDLRTASRTPGYAFLIILPLLDALVLSLSSYVGTTRPSSVFNLAAAAISTAALLATFFGPAFFATEIMGYSYTRSLPLSRRSLLWGKASLVLLIYVIATALVAGATLSHIFAPLLFLAFAIAELPGLAAAVFLELGIIVRRAEKQGVPLTNLYTGAWWATAVVIPGILVAGLPLFAFTFLNASGTNPYHALSWMATIALGELAIFGPFALGLPGRGRL